MPLYIRCSRCGQRRERGQPCVCEAAFEKRRGEKRVYKKAEGTRKLYHTGRWKDLREVVLSLHSGLDPWARAHGRIEYAETVHHIVPAEEHPESFFNPENLVPLSKRSHAEVHALYRASDEGKRQTQKELFALVKLVEGRGV